MKIFPIPISYELSIIEQEDIKYVTISRLIKLFGNNDYSYSFQLLQIYFRTLCLILNKFISIILEIINSNDELIKKIYKILLYELIFLKNLDKHKIDCLEYNIITLFIQNLIDFIISNNNEEIRPLHYLENVIIGISDIKITNQYDDFFDYICLSYKMYYDDIQYILEFKDYLDECFNDLFDSYYHIICKYSEIISTLSSQLKIDILAITNNIRNLNIDNLFDNENYVSFLHRYDLYKDIINNIRNNYNKYIKSSEVIKNGSISNNQYKHVLRKTYSKSKLFINKIMVFYDGRLRIDKYY